MVYSINRRTSGFLLRPMRLSFTNLWAFSGPFHSLPLHCRPFLYIPWWRSFAVKDSNWLIKHFSIEILFYVLIGLAFLIGFIFDLGNWINRFSMASFRGYPLKRWCSHGGPFEIIQKMKIISGSLPFAAIAHKILELVWRMITPCLIHSVISQKM